MSMTTLLETVIVILLLLVASEISNSECQYRAPVALRFVDEGTIRCREPSTHSRLAIHSSAHQNTFSDR